MSSPVVLKWYLRLIGFVELCAIPFIAIPLRWMMVAHEDYLKMGPMPEGPVVEYLARTLSALYAVHGAMIFAISFDVVRYRPLIVLLSLLHFLGGLVFLGIDFVSNMPWYWTVCEGPPVALGGVLMFILVKKIPKSAHISSSSTFPV